MRYNLHIIKCIHFNCTIQCVLTNVRPPQSTYETFLGQFTHAPFQLVPPGHVRQPLLFYHCRSILPVLELHINGVIHYILCCVSFLLLGLRLLLLVYLWDINMFFASIVPFFLLLSSLSLYRYIAFCFSILLLIVICFLF